MKSSFVRKGAASTADVGTRPGLHGQTLISTGWADWDRVLRGGLPLGTVTLLIEDCHSQQHVNFMRYFLAEAVANKQPAAWFSSTAPEGGAANLLPALVTEDTTSSTTSTSSGSSAKKTTTSNPSSATGQQAGGQEGGEGGELRIAWQYRKYIQSAQSQRDQEQAELEAAGKAKARPSSSGAGGAPSRSAAQKAVESGVARQWCHNYDLSRSMASDLVQQHGLVCQDCSTTGDLTNAVQKATEFISRFSPPSPSTSTTPGAPPVPVRAPPTPAGRVVLQSLLSPAWRGLGSTPQSGPPGTQQQQQPGDEDEGVRREAARALFVLRQAVMDTRCAVLVTLQADLLPPSWLLRFQHLCHVVMTLDCISDSSDVYKLLPDPTSAAALLSIQRLPALGMLAPRIPDPQLYVVRHKRRKMAITPVEVDPDAEARQQEALAAAAAGVTAGVAGLGIKQQGERGAGAPRATGRAQPAQGLDF